MTMAKIRGIKPETWTDDKFVELSAHARLLFIGMWNFACDNGHLEDRSRQLKMRIFPADDVNVAELLRELEALGCIERGDGWITVPNLTEHQKVDVRYFTTCDKPGCDDPPEKIAKRESRRAPAGHTSGTRRVPTVSTTCAHGDGDGDGDGEEEQCAPDGAQSDRFAEFWDAYPKKVSKKRAQDRWRAATKRTDPQVILDGLARYCAFLAQPGQWQKPKDPDGWLSQERWADELDTATNVHHLPIASDEGAPWMTGRA